MNEIEESRNLAAVLVLIKVSSDGSSVLLIERSATVKTHRSQVAFPGGGVEPQDDQNPIFTALRECSEEVGIHPDHVRVLKTLPPLPTLTSGFFVVPVLATFEPKEQTAEGIAIQLDEREVAHAEWVSVQALRKTRKVEMGFPEFVWTGQDQQSRRVWGLTAIIFDLVFNSDAHSL